MIRISTKTTSTSTTSSVATDRGRGGRGGGSAHEQGRSLEFVPAAMDGIKTFRGVQKGFMGNINRAFIRVFIGRL